MCSSECKKLENQMVKQSNSFCVSLSGLLPIKINMALFYTQTARRQTLSQAMCIDYENPATFHYISQIQHTPVCQQSNLKIDTLLSRSVLKT